MELLGEAEFWVAVAFVIFVAALGRPLLARVNAALDARAARIKADLDEARRLRDEAERLLSDYRQKQRDAQRAAAAILQRARDEVERMKADAAAGLAAALARREKAAMDKIAQAEADAAAELRREAADIAVAAARLVLAEGLDEARASTLIDKSIAELGRKLH